MDLMNVLLGGVVGAVFGLVTAWFFERRAVNTARAETERVRRELQALQESIYTVGGGRTGARGRTQPSEALSEELRDWLERHQDAGGRVFTGLAVSEFVARGAAADDVEVAIDDLQREGYVVIEGDRVRIR